MEDILNKHGRQSRSRAVLRTVSSNPGHTKGLPDQIFRDGEHESDLDLTHNVFPNPKYAIEGVLD